MQICVWLVSQKIWHVNCQGSRKQINKKIKNCCYRGGGESPKTNAYLREILKENEKFSGHIIFDKNNFFVFEKIFFTRVQ